MDSMEIHKKNQAKILIVDDKKANLIAFTQVLDELPATIIQANSGAQALQLITEHKFALVLLDVQMPGMDGFETAELMKSRSFGISNNPRRRRRRFSAAQVWSKIITVVPSSSRISRCTRAR